MKIVPVVRRAKLKTIDEELEDMLYWLSKSPRERVAAVNKLVFLKAWSTASGWIRPML